MVRRQLPGTIMIDDLPPLPRNERSGFATELGRTLGGFAMMALLIAIAGALLWFFLHSP
jgi:hypothetical protein